MYTNGYIDLHVHSTASDGKKSPEEVIDIAIQNGVSVISLTEHYNLGSYKSAKMAAQDRLEVIPGIEIGSTLIPLGYSKKHICHIAAYYPNYNICKILDEYELSREKCVRRTIEKLKKYVPISYNKVKKFARNKNSIGRFDIAIALYKLGYANDPTSAYGEYLDTGKSCYVDRMKQSPEELIKNIRQVNGVPVLVHPKSLRLNLEDTFNLLIKFKAYGLEGIEAYNPHHTTEQTNAYLDIAKELSLVTTVGSDYHARKDQDIEIGLGIDNNLKVNDYSMITELKKRQNKVLND